MITDFSKICVIIPAYQPSEMFIPFIERLSRLDFRQLIIINDGSDKSKENIFEQVKQFPQVTLINHPKNLGKGAAIKTGIKVALQMFPQDLAGVITADADGQHLPEDIKKIALALLANPGALILGVRGFDKDVPLRSRFGNSLTRWIFRKQYKIDIKDTQTGLRGIPRRLIEPYLKIPESGYEFEMACLIYAVKNGYPIEQITISTVYIDKNVSSHFNPVVDSVRIYYIFMRFALSSMLSYVIDLSLFIVLHSLTQTIFVSLLIARLVSSSFNFYQNKFMVYRSHDMALFKREATSYVLLSIVIFILSYFLITLLVHHGVGVIIAKVVVDGFLFLLNFLLQRHLVFRKNSK